MNLISDDIILDFHFLSHRRNYSSFFLFLFSPPSLSSQSEPGTSCWSYHKLQTPRRQSTLFGFTPCCETRLVILCRCWCVQVVGLLTVVQSAAPFFLGFPTLDSRNAAPIASLIPHLCIHRQPPLRRLHRCRSCLIPWSAPRESAHSPRFSFRFSSPRSFFLVHFLASIDSVSPWEISGESSRIGDPTKYLVQGITKRDSRLGAIYPRPSLVLACVCLSCDTCLSKSNRDRLHRRPHTISTIDIQDHTIPTQGVDTA